MIKETISGLFSRELDTLSKEISLYADESAIWRIEQGIANSGGNLCLHLIGNLNHFIGSILGNTGYVRDRDQEFSEKNVPKDKLLDSIDDTRATVIKTFGIMSESDLERDFPVMYRDAFVSTGFMLMHLLAHLNYHLGQINYHRRLLDKN